MRAWLGDVKYVATGKRFNLSGQSFENRAIIYTTARLKEARIRNQVAKANDGEVGFDDDDLDFDANLAKFGVSVAHLKSPEKRKFYAWLTEEDKRRWKHNDQVSEIYLLEKFKNLRFYLPDKDAVYKVCNKNLDWKGRDGWVAIAKKEGGNDSDDEPITLELVCKLIADSADKNEDVKIVKAPES